MADFLITANPSPTWLQVAAAIPAAAMLWTLICWTPRGRRQWYLAAGMIVYVACYYFLFVRHWGTAPLAAGAAMVIPIMGFRDFWNEGRFWITVLLLGAAQVPLTGSCPGAARNFSTPP